MADPHNKDGAPPRSIHIEKKKVNWLAWIALAAGILALLFALVVAGTTRQSQLHRPPVRRRPKSWRRPQARRRQQRLRVPQALVVTSVVPKLRRDIPVRTTDFRYG